MLPNTVGRRGPHRSLPIIRSYWDEEMEKAVATADIVRKIVFSEHETRALQHTWIQSVAKTRVKGFRYTCRDTGPVSSRSRGIL